MTRVDDWREWVFSKKVKTLFFSFSCDCRRWSGQGLSSVVPPSLSIYLLLLPTDLRLTSTRSPRCVVFRFGVQNTQFSVTSPILLFFSFYVFFYFFRFFLCEFNTWRNFVFSWDSLSEVETKEEEIGGDKNTRFPHDM